MLHAKIWLGNQFNELSPREKLLFIGMITIADDEGRLRGDVRYLKSQIFPYEKVSGNRVRMMRDHINDIGLIQFYTANKHEIISHPGWYKYQSLDKRRSKPSVFPPPNYQSIQASARQELAQDKVIAREVNTEVNEIQDEGDAQIMSDHGRQMLDAMNQAKRQQEGL